MTSNDFSFTSRRYVRLKFVTFQQIFFFLYLSNKFPLNFHKNSIYFWRGWHYVSLVRYSWQEGTVPSKVRTSAIAHCFHPLSRQQMYTVHQKMYIFQTWAVQETCIFIFASYKDIGWFGTCGWWWGSENFVQKRQKMVKVCDYFRLKWAPVSCTAQRPSLG